jgi:type IV pilus assembly protein PilO
MAGEGKGFNKLKPLHQVLVVTILCGALLGAVWYYVLTPMQEEITGQETQLADLQAKINKGLMRKAVLEEFKKESKALEVRLEELKQVLPLDKETDEVLRQVQASAQSSGLKIQSIVPKPLIDHEVYTEWPLTMEVGGTYHDLGTFLDKIRKLPRIVNIGALKIAVRGASETSLSANVSVTYTATTFVYREEVPAPPAKPVKGN